MTARKPKQATQEEVFAISLACMQRRALVLQLPETAMLLQAALQKIGWEIAEKKESL